MRSVAVTAWSSALAVVAAGVAARWIDVTGYVPIVQSVFPVFGVGAVALTGVALLARFRKLAALGALVALAPTVLAAQSLLPQSGATVSAGAADEVVMSANLELGQADAREVVQAVRSHHVTTLVLLEVTPREVSALRAAGLDEVLPNVVGNPHAGSTGSMVRSTHRLTLIDDHAGSTYPDSPEVRVRTSAGAYRLRAVHPPAPLPNIVEDWRRGLRSVQQWREGVPDHEPLVMAGDFNASSAMPAFRAVADTMTDTARATGSGWVRTWPNGKGIPRFVQLDHVLVRGFGVVASGAVTIADTDHQAVWARIRLR